MTWGIQTWDANGVPNNYGIKPVSVVGTVQLTQGQTSGSYSFTVPAGMRVGFTFTLESGNSPNIGRRVVANGNTITVSPASTVGVGNYSSNSCLMIVFVEV